MSEHGRVCLGCGIWKEAAAFSVSARGKGGLHPRCKACRCAAARAGYAANPEARERQRERSRAYQARSRKPLAEQRRQERAACTIEAYRLCTQEQLTVAETAARLGLKADALHVRLWRAGYRLTRGARKRERPRLHATDEQDGSHP